MAATALSAVSRYVPLGTRQWYWVASIANPASPTRAELDAGTDLTGEVMENDGWTVSSDSVEAPDAANRFAPKIPTKITADDSSLSIYLDEDSGDIRATLKQDTKGFIVIFPEGDDGAENDHTMDVYPVTVASASKSSGFEDPAVLVVMFTITAKPSIDVAVPADT